MAKRGTNTDSVAAARTTRSVLKTLLLTWVLATVSAPALLNAEEVMDMYRQAVVVQDQSDDLRAAAAKEALQSVLVRVSGHKSVLEQPEIASVLARASTYVDAYRYEEVDMAVNEQGEPVTRLVMNFSRPALEKLLREYKLPLWPSNRPSVLVWVVKDDLQEGRQMISLQEDSVAATAVDNAAQIRGLPLVYPLLDLEDRITLTPSQLWNLDQDAIDAASARYNTDAVLVVRYSQTASGRWLSDWTLVHKQHRPVFDVDADSEVALLSLGLAQASEYLASLYQVVLGGAVADNVVLDIDAVKGFGDYIQLMEYLQSLEVVQQMTLNRISGTHLQVTLQLKGEVSLLTAVLGLDRRLIKQERLPQKPTVTVTDPKATAVMNPSSPHQPLLYFSWLG